MGKKESNKHYYGFLAYSAHTYSERVQSVYVNVYQYCAASVIQQRLTSVTEFIDWNG